MTNPEDPAEKPLLRATARKAVEKMTPEARRRESEALCRTIATWLASHPAPIRAATFAALPDEPDLGGLHALCPDIEWSYPRIDDRGQLVFHAVPDPASLRPGAMGIREPDPQRHPATPVSRLAVVLCPGLAFSPDGTRLGRGKGHYDRALAGAAADCLRVGVSFEAARMAALPREAHDVRMTHLAGLATVAPAS
ncbi:MAG: 5-formyltetrahydrofolate cyclo-ligase [Akkermansiaceae bacterium]|nr:5-formyltetrahydrofolate cyclo-ligase [Akkermansiaceae bacterium]